MRQNPWHNEYPLDPMRVGEIISADIDQFDVTRVSVLGEGWDFCTFVVNDEWVFRFPKRRQCARQLAREHKLLELLAGSLGNDSIAIPRYRFYVRTPTLFTLAYVGYPMLRGDALIDCAVDSIDRAAIGRQLGGFLQRLNAAAPKPPPRIYHDQFPENLIDFRRELDDASVSMPPHIAAACRRLLAMTPTPDDAAPLFQHGDLGVEHILVDRRSSRITAIIDWGDAGWGDPVGGLVGLWAWGGDTAVHAALSGWGRVLSDDAWSRLRLWGVAYAIGSAYYGYKDRRDALHATALGWLERMYSADQLDDPETPDA